MARAMERSVPSLSSTPSAADRPVPPEYTQKPTLPLLRLSEVLAEGEPPPDSRRTAQLAELEALSTSLTWSEQLPFFRDRKIGAFQWGLVKGRSQTHLPWPGFAGATTGNQEWFHDILTEEGEPYAPAELDTIRALRAVKG